jgi:hypothetical protein
VLSEFKPEEEVSRPMQVIGDGVVVRDGEVCWVG